jgi:serine/threonine protein kinase/tetratricopeptide (TPR) repeat protein
MSEPLTPADVNESAAERTASVQPAGATQDFKPAAAPSNRNAAANVQVPGYKMLGVLGRGGMGVVYKAIQEKANRLVALKMILAGSHADQSDRLRFKAEAEAAARLSHPNIVQLYEVSETPEGFPFFSLEFVSGGTLAERLKQGPLRPLEAAALVESLARAMQYAHERGIVHRDLKPLNILLEGGSASQAASSIAQADSLKATLKAGKPDATPRTFTASASLSASGNQSLAVPKISDFGLAKQLDSEDGLTRTGAIMGSPAYMAPEQAFGQSKTVGPAADIYALGAILYECLTGRPPFKGATIADTLEQVRTMEPITLKAYTKEIPADLETICLHCLHKEPQRRYASAEALADDLRRYCEGKPITVRPVGNLERAWRWCRRNPGWAAMIALVAACLVGTTVVSLGAYVDVSAQRDIAKGKQKEADEERKKAEKARDEAKEKKELAEARGEQALKALGLFGTDGLAYFQDAVVPGESRTRVYGGLIAQLEEQAKNASGEATVDALRNKVFIYQTLCQVTLDFRDYAKSKECFEKGMEGLDQWEKKEPGNAIALSFRGTLLNLRADGLKAAGKLESANQLYAESLQIREKLVGNPDDDLPAKVDEIARLCDSLDSMEQFEKSIELRTKICTMYAEEAKKYAHDSSKRKEVAERSFPYRDALCSTCEKAGMHASEYAPRKKYLTRAGEMSRALHEERKSSRNILLRWALVARMLGELEYSHGILAAKEGKPAEAFFAAAANQYETLNKEITVKLATSHDLIEPLRDYARSYYTLGLAEKRKGNRAKADTHFETSRIIRERTLRDYPHTANSGHLKIDLWFSQLALGDLGMMAEVRENGFIFGGGEPDLAYRLACIFALASTAIEERRNGEPLTSRETQDQRMYRNEAFRCLQVAHDRGFTDFFQSNIDADLEAIRDDPRMKEFEVTHYYHLGVLEQKRGAAGAEQARQHFEKAHAAAEQAIKALKGDARQVHVRLSGLCVRIQLGQHGEAIAEADAMRPKLPWLDGDAAQFRLARVYALASGKVKDAKLKEECCTKAVIALGKAGAIATEARLVAEDDLEPIRGDPRFRKILEQAKKQPRVAQ